MFGIADYGAFCAAIVLFLALPGPGTFTLLSSTAKGGLRGGTAATAGVILGDQVLLWMAVAGVAALLAAHPMLFKSVQYIGAVYLAWIGFRLITAKPGQPTPFEVKPSHYTKQAFWVTLLNPKAIVFYMAFFPLFIDPAQHQGMLTFVAMAGTIASITAIYCLLLCSFAGAVSVRVKAHRRLASALQRVAGLCLVAFGIRLGTQ